MQLNYSRAFGGKDLKKYGLLATPDITQVQLTKEDRLVVIFTVAIQPSLPPLHLCLLSTPPLQIAHPSLRWLVGRGVSRQCGASCGRFHNCRP